MTIEEAYEEMKRRNWGFAHIGTRIAIGPYDGKLVEVYGIDFDPVQAVLKAIQTEEQKDGRNQNPKVT